MVLILRYHDACRFTREEVSTPPIKTDNRSTSPGIRKPYQKPAIRYERVFETMALACGKVSSTQAQCASVLKFS